MHEKIYSLARSIASPGETEEALLEALCTAAEAELTGRLREGLTAEDCGEAFPCAAALMAVSALLPCRESGGVEQFTVGDVSIRAGGGTLDGAASALRSQAQRLMAAYCGDDGFAFLGVRG